MRYFITLITILGTIFMFLMYGANAVKAGEYEKAVIGNVIQNEVNGTSVDVNKLMEQELQKLAHQFAIESITILQAYLPTILEGLAADMRMKADKEYKCALLKGSKIEDDCND